MNDQLQLWNNAHAKHWLSAHSQKQTAFAEEVNAQLPPSATILELGCGEGNDSVYFANLGHNVVATDFSDVVIKENSARLKHPHLQFQVQDMRQRLNFEDEQFDAIYARLSLHYFTHEDTVKIFKEMARILSKGGTLFFMCKEVSDSLYGKGVKLEDDMFELDGHVRHFFSEPYVEKLLPAAGLEAKSVVTGKEQIYDRQSAFLKAAAVKPR